MQAVDEDEFAARSEQPPLVLALLRRRAELACLRAEWDELARLAAPRHPFMDAGWQLAWLESHARNLQPWVWTARDAQGRLRALWPLARRWRRGLRCLHWLAEDSGGDELDILLHPAADLATARALYQAAMRRRGWDWMRLQSIQPTGILAQIFNSSAPTATVRTGLELPFLPLPSSLDALLAARSPNFRSEVRRRRRRMEHALPGLTCHCAEGAPAVAREMPTLMRLHRDRREQKQDAGIFARAEVREFHQRLLPALAARTQPRLYWLEAQGRPLAALYGFARADRFLYFQSGFDPSAAGFSPGTVLLSHVLEDCMRRQEREFDFLRGDEAYKSRWTRQSRQALAWETARTRRGAWYQRGRNSRLVSICRQWKYRSRGHSGRKTDEAHPNQPATSACATEQSAAGAPPSLATASRHDWRYQIQAGFWYVRHARNWPHILLHKIFHRDLTAIQLRNGPEIEFLPGDAALWQIGEIYWRGVYDRHFTSASIEAGSWIVDLGANIGAFAVHAARRWGAGEHLLAVEPNPACAAVLRRNLRRNGLEAARVLEAAVSARPGPARLFQDARATDARLMPGAEDGAAGLRVPCLRLEQVLAEIPRVGLLKLDIEGEEYGLLWAENTVWEKVERLALEYHERAPEARPAAALLNRLRELGFDIVHHAQPESHLGYVLAQRAARQKAAA